MSMKTAIRTRFTGMPHHFCGIPIVPDEENGISQGMPIQEKAEKQSYSHGPEGLERKISSGNPAHEEKVKGFLTKRGQRNGEAVRQEQYEASPEKLGSNGGDDGGDPHENH